LRKLSLEITGGVKAPYTSHDLDISSTMNNTPEKDEFPFKKAPGI
jgi:hypothetical protein